MIASLEDILIAGRTVYGEARGEPYEGKKAVVHVLMNRVNHPGGGSDHSLASACLRWRQFSAWNEDDLNRRAMKIIGLHDPVFRACLRAVLEALDESDTTKGSRHYMTKDRLAQGWPKSWGPKREPVVEIGAHLFYNDVN